MNTLKTLLILVALFVLPAHAQLPPPAPDINATHSGSWYNADQDGHGLSVAVLDTRTLIYWYVYDPDGNPTFLITVGQNDGNTTTGETYIQAGMKFGGFNPNDVQRKVWGTVTLSFNDCDSALLEYASNDPRYGNGTIPMSRLASIQGSQCKNSPLQGNYSISQSATDEESGAQIVTTGIAVLLADNTLAYFLGVETPGFGITVETTGFGNWFNIGEEDNSIELNVTSGSTQITSNGSFSQDGFWAFRNDFTAALTATLLPSFQNGLSYQVLAGTYNIVVTDIVIGDITVAQDGSVAGTVGECQAEGNIQIPDHKFNQATFDIDLSGCDSAGNLTGVLIRGDSGGLALIGNDGQSGFAWSLF